jgi:enoyl-CoA hydratase/carnithine racemase
MSNPSPLVKVHVHESTGTVVLNRPEKRNALTRALLAELAQAIEDLRCERRVRTVVLAGSGSAFCAGMDLNEMQETAKSPEAADLWRDDAEAYRDVLEAMLRLPKPIIATVGGAAVAGGAGLVLACDPCWVRPKPNSACPNQNAASSRGWSRRCSRFGWELVARPIC